MTDFDKDKPAGSTKLRLADDEIRTNNYALEDAIGRDHKFPTGDGVDSGEHSKITLNAPLGADPSNVADKGFVYTKDVSGKVELFWEDEDGNVIQLTAAGLLLGTIPSGDIILFDKDTAAVGFTLKTDVDDVGIHITSGSVAGGETGGAAHSTGTWTQPNHSHTTQGHTLTIDEIPSHTHDRGDHIGVSGSTYASLDSTLDKETDEAHLVGYTGGGGSHSHGATGNSATANTWRFAGRCMTRQERN